MNQARNPAIRTYALAVVLSSGKLSLNMKPEEESTGPDKISVIQCSKAWGVPGWIGNGTFFSEELGSQGSYRTVPCILFVDTLQDNIFYHVSWLTCIKAPQLTGKAR